MNFRYSFFLFACCLLFMVARAQSADPELMVAPGSLTAASATLLWNKMAAGARYELLLDGKPVAATDKTHHTLEGLRAGTRYRVQLRLPGGRKSQALRFRTANRGQVLTVLDYGALGDGKTLNTRAIQAAIDACPEGGTVRLPAGVFVSGSLFLKSNMTFQVDKGATLKGSESVDDYLPMIPNRFEGWELSTYASLLNGGRLDRQGGYNLRNLRITGGGTIAGGGRRLGEAMIKANGLRSRGRLILLMNSQDVSISNLTLTEPPSWTLHYIYSQRISCHGLTIITNGIRNGDGIDPDSSTDSYIFDCLFDTGDDCIAIKSGKNPEGYYIGKPTRNVRITHCNFRRGHGISIGSEMSGGVSEVLVRDCQAGALLHGLQIKGTKDRGGYVRNIRVEDCQLLKITVFSAVNYNNDGEAAPQVPIFENFVFRNIDLGAANIKEAVININGFREPGHRLRNVSFEGVRLPEGARVEVRDAENVIFEKVKTLSGAEPEYRLTNTEKIQGAGPKKG